MNNVRQINSFAPDYLVKPGEVIENYLEYAGFTQSSLAERTGLSKKTINEIIKTKSAITAKTALKLERTLGRPAHFWSNLERQYQEDRIRLADKIQLETHLQWLAFFPINNMAKLGWIEKNKDKVKQLEALLRFFAVASPVEWETIWVQGLQAAFRKTNNAKENTGIISAWLRQGEIVAGEQSYGQYDKERFENNLDEIRKLTLEDLDTFTPKLKLLCSEAGVSIVFVPALPKLGIYGATRWLNDRPVMQLSLYLKSNDHLWFTFFHEACHVLRHGRKELFIEGGGLESKEETEANAFASDKLIPPAELRRFLASRFKPTLNQIERFAANIGIAPGIVVGRLQHDKRLSITVGNHLKVRVGCI